MTTVIPDKYFHFFEEIGITRTYTEETAVFSATDEADSLYLIVSGRLRVYALTAEGKEITFEVLKKGRIFGEAAFAQNALRRVNICAVTDAVLIECTPDTLVPLLCQKPELLILVIRHLSETDDTLTHQIIRLTAYDSTMAIADFLLDNTTVQKPLLPYTQEDLAVSLSLNRVTVARIMKKFRDQKWIDYSYGTIRVTNRHELEKLLPEYQGNDSSSQ